MATTKAAKLCNACYQYLYYWQDKSVTDKMKRMKQISLWQERLGKMIRGMSKKRSA